MVVGLSLSGEHCWLNKKLGESLKFPRQEHPQKSHDPVESFKPQVINELPGRPIPLDKRVSTQIDGELRTEPETDHILSWDQAGLQRQAEAKCYQNSSI